MSKDLPVSDEENKKNISPKVEKKAAKELEQEMIRNNEKPKPVKRWRKKNN